MAKTSLKSRFAKFDKKEDKGEPKKAQTKREEGKEFKAFAKKAKSKRK